MTERNHDSRVNPEARLSAPPLSPHLAAIWGAFLHEGVMLNKERGTRLLEIWGNGCIELISTLCDFIPDIWKQVQPYWYGPQGFPGVFEYEVVVTFFSQGGSHEIPSDQTPQTHRLINLHDRFTERLTQLEGGHS